LLSKPALILQHGPLGTPGRLGEWLDERGIAVVVHRTWEDPLPDPADYGFIASLGSQFSATDRDPEWIPREIELLADAVEQDIPVLGLCFGGQALSVALGGGVDVLPTPEIGWVAVDSTDASVPLGPWVQYHREVMRVPPGARELARSPVGPAAFRSGRHLGLQFHPEADGVLFDAWARMDPTLPETGITPSELAAQSAIHSEAARAQAFQLFDGWFAGAFGLERVSGAQESRG
jgi:GMP synthase-like glutamine amidotransferase